MELHRMEVRVKTGNVIKVNEEKVGGTIGLLPILWPDVGTSLVFSPDWHSEAGLHLAIINFATKC